MPLVNVMVNGRSDGQEKCEALVRCRYQLRPAARPTKRG